MLARLFFVLFVGFGMFGSMLYAEGLFQMLRGDTKQAKDEQEARSRAEQETRSRAEEKARAEQEARSRAEQETRSRAEEKARAEQEAKAKKERDLKAQKCQEAVRVARSELARAKSWFNDNEKAIADALNNLDRSREDCIGSNLESNYHKMIDKMEGEL